ncbi:hypothetical protein H0H93_002048, partial [Arthromyces matolae]
MEVTVDNAIWEEHISTTTLVTGEVVYTCNYGGECGYSSSKQSVKRHVLGTHLKFKWVASFIQWNLIYNVNLDLTNVHIARSNFL